MRTHFFNRGHKKRRLGRITLSDVLSRGMDLRTHNLLSSVLKNIFREVDEAMFQDVEGHANSFCASWASKKATLTKSFK
jgi:hypothetical protein